MFERMRVERLDPKRNAAVADEVRRTLVEIDEIETQLKKAETAIEKAQALTAKYRARLAGLCDSAAGGWKKGTWRTPGRTPWIAIGIKGAFLGRQSSTRDMNEWTNAEIETRLAAGRDAE